MKLTVQNLCYLMDFREMVEIVLDDKVIGPIEYHKLWYAGYEKIGIHAIKKGLLFLRCKDPREEIDYYNNLWYKNIVDG